MTRTTLARLALGAVALIVSAAPRAVAPPPDSGPGRRVLLDAHNAYPYNGRFADRIDRALATGLPVAIEQDLVWRPATASRPARSIVSHGEPFDEREPSLRTHFFERMRPIVEEALRRGDSTDWPLVVLNLDLKSNEAAHHRALWELLGEYEAWITTAPRTADGRPAPLDTKPVLVLTGESDAQARAFHDELPVGRRLRLFGAMPIRPADASDADREKAAAAFWQALPNGPLPTATNYRRWWNAPWAVVEAGGQRQAGDWTPADERRLRTLVRRAHEAGLWIRLWTINGHPAGEESTTGWSAGYNVGSIDAARLRWRAAIAAGVDFVATDQYEAFAAERPVRSRRSSPREIVIKGTLTSADRLAWLERPFEVPAGAQRIDVYTTYEDRDAGTAIEFGLYDPARFRGASRTNKSRFFVARHAATPSYAPGELPPGTWRLLMGVPSIRDGASSDYRAMIRITVEGEADPAPFAVPDAVAAKGPRWYHGDLHAHTMHSDGFGCTDGRGHAGPCAAHLIADLAERRGLDFVAITDHNTTSHHAGMVEVQARHDELLLLRGQEMTTFYGHANVFGTSEVIDFRIGPSSFTVSDAFRMARRLGGVVSINHPGRETGERCTGCGWTAPRTDYALVDAIEVVNGSTVSGPTAGEPFWHARLNEGYRLTGIGGGDDHGAGSRAGSSVGTPTTVVYAASLTEAAILAGIRAGRVYIKTRGPLGPDLRLEIPTLGARMGDSVSLDGGAGPVTFRVTTAGARGQHLEVVHNGRRAPAAETVVPSDDANVDVTLKVARGDWVRVNLRDAVGMTAMANPIYFR